jgi:cyclohexanecarboxylate-CoA ligase
MEAWEPAEAWQRIAKYGCTAAVTATPFLQMLMGAYDPDRHDAASLRLWVCAGSPIPGSVVRRAGEQFAGCRVLSLYGRSENFLTTMCTLDDAPDRSATSDGSAIAGASVKIVDELGDEVPRGAQGDITYRGPSHMLEYYRDPEQTAALFTADGHSRSGDLGVMDADGYVRVTGRLKDIVIRGGLNISARELEELLVDHPRVAAVAVVGMPDERLGERVCAYVPGLG